MAKTTPLLRVRTLTGSESSNLSVSATKSPIHIGLFFISKNSMYNDTMIVQKHRPDIEGLRAVAIMAVILFHSSLATFSGGYVGVDVFFVISGFLITKSINHRSANNEFSFLNYYIARIKRIYPLLILILSLQLLIAPYFY